MLGLVYTVSRKPELATAIRAPAHERRRHKEIEGEVVYLTKPPAGICSTETEDYQTGVPQIEVTPEMIEAGVDEAKVHCLGASLSDLVRNVYVAMSLEQREQAWRPRRSGP